MQSSGDDDASQFMLRSGAEGGDDGESSYLLLADDAGTHHSHSQPLLRAGHDRVVTGRVPHHDEQLRHHDERQQHVMLQAPDHGAPVQRGIMHSAGDSLLHPHASSSQQHVIVHGPGPAQHRGGVVQVAVNAINPPPQLQTSTTLASVATAAGVSATAPQQVTVPLYAPVGNGLAAAAIRRPNAGHASAQATVTAHVHDGTEDPTRAGRVTQRFHIDHRQQLEDEYQSNPNPSPARIEELALKLDESAVRIQTWFMNRKAKDGTRGAPRTRFSMESVSILKEAYAQNPAPDKKRLIQLSETTQEPYKRVKNWFMNRRTKDSARAAAAKARVMPAAVAGGSTLAHVVGVGGDMAGSPAAVGSNGVRKTRRTRISPAAVEVFKEYYKQSPIPSREALRSLAAQTEETVGRVRNWFCNTRAKDRDYTPTTSGSRRFAPEHIDLFEATYAQEQRPTAESLAALSSATGEAKSRIATWFTNRRSKTPGAMRRSEGLKRCRLSKMALAAFRDVYAANKWPDAPTIEALAARTSETVARVRNWFHNRRAKDRGRGPTKRRKLQGKALQMCEQEFAVSQSPAAEVISRLAEASGEAETRLKVWFSNKRARVRNREGKAPGERRRKRQRTTASTNGELEAGAGQGEGLAAPAVSVGVELRGVSPLISHSVTSHSHPGPHGVLNTSLPMMTALNEPSAAQSSQGFSSGTQLSADSMLATDPTKSVVVMPPSGADNHVQIGTYTGATYKC